MKTYSEWSETSNIDLKISVHIIINYKYYMNPHIEVQPSNSSRPMSEIV